ncbi:uncharacterized protein [Coffea arabica]|uniref:Uncharacterized protein isoform X2 n=1 Tax=Coffea arabica TaxID=13443 RepID=A0ABM4U3I2_COFAR
MWLILIDRRSRRLHVPGIGAKLQRLLIIFRFAFGIQSLCRLALHGIRSVNLATCKALKELKLSGAGDTTNFGHQALTFQIQALEALEFRSCHGLGSIRISSQRLQRLAFRDCRTFQVLKLTLQI